MTRTSAPAATVDVVVVAYNSAGRLRACVEPLAGVPRITVTVVDNASPDDTASAIAGLPVELVEAPRNGGFAYGCNLGMGRGSGELVLLLNPDARLGADDLAVLVDALRARPALGGVGPRLLGDDGELLWSQRRFPRLRSTFASALFLQRLAPHAAWSDETIRDREAYEQPGTPDWLSGACLLLRRNAVEAVGGLDEGFFLYCEETDLFRRLAAEGWQAGYEPAATARHAGGASAPRHTTERISARSRVRYARKHHGPLVALLEAIGVVVGGLAHAAVWPHRPVIARGHLGAARAALGAIASPGGAA